MKPFVKPLIAAKALCTVILIVPMLHCAYAQNAPDPHAHHHHMMKQGDNMAEGTTRTTAEYKLPQFSLIRADGKTVSLPDELNDGRAVVLNFIFTTCTAICPITSQIFSQLQSKLGNYQDKVHLVSISIDPQNDTPAVLREYAKKFEAGKSWEFYTGTVDASIAAQRAFNVYRGDKMNHMPVTLLRAAPGKPWVRISGFATAEDLLREFKEIVAFK
jgi:protein SCO1/2